MRAHEKMLLNSKLFIAMPYLRHYGKAAGCALGMIEGPEVENSVINRHQAAEYLYPWMENRVPRPCRCSVNWTPRVGSCVGIGIHAITHLFNEHVMGGGEYPEAEPWTLERLADYIKSIDPTVDQEEELICETEVEHEHQEVKA